MIHGFQREYTPVCDVCGETLATECDFYDAVKAIKAAGWVSRRDKTDWTHICRDCQESGGADENG